MSLSPRKNETDAVVAILESGAYDDAVDMAKAIVRSLGTELARRETFVVFPPNAPHGHGPFWTQTEAERAWTKEIGAHFSGAGRLLRTFPWEPKADELAACECGHEREIHVIRGPKNKPGKPTDCGVLLRKTKDSKCPCVTYSPRKAA